MFNIEDLDLNYSPMHYQKKFASQTLDWCPSDGFEDFEQNIKDPKKIKYLKQQGWLEPGCFQYQFNEHGFRTKALDQNSNAVVGLGCSHTTGIGLPQQDVWIERLAKLCNLDCVNLGVASASLDTVFRIANYWLKEIQPKIVVLLCPTFNRFEIRKSKTDISVFLPENNWMTSDQKIISKHWWVNDENLYYNAAKNIYAVQKICTDLDIDLYCYTGQEMVTFDLARDFLHHGPLAHDAFAKKVYNDITGINCE